MYQVYKKFTSQTNLRGPWMLPASSQIIRHTNGFTTNTEDKSGLISTILPEKAKQMAIFASLTLDF